MPDLLDLIAREAGPPPPVGSPGAPGWSGRALVVARQGRLPLPLVAAALGSAWTDTVAWRTALVDDAQLAETRRRTLEVLAAALGPMRNRVALGAPAWREFSGRDVDLLCTDVPAAARALAAAGLLPVPTHDEPGRRVLLRVDGGAAVDLVDLEAVPASDLVVGGGTADGWALLTPEARARRWRHRAAARGRLRLVDLADAEELGLEATTELDPAELDAAVPDRAELDRAGAGRSAPVPRSDALQRPPRRIRVAVRGPGATAEATRLAASLEVAALDVAAVGALGLARAVVRSVRDRAVLIGVGPPVALWPGAIRHRAPVEPSPDAAEALLRRVLEAGQGAGRNA